MTFIPVSQAPNADHPSRMRERSPSADEMIGAISRVTAAFAARSDVGPQEIVELANALGEVFSGLLFSGGAQADKARPAAAGAAARREAITPIPVIPIEQSVTDDRVYCLCCGQGFSMLKRHLKSQHGLSEEQYRALYSLPFDMPLVAPSYSRRKAAYAKSIGLGGYRRDTSAGKADRLLS
ncbi:MucR family transcriptional regulator [Pseudodonghicola sp.]|uniref:MucR family transcriptional regulator n=1 Tax=Pseudodonghicola sp. TaxID=1969463 RepID=UPI003A98551F